MDIYQRIKLLLKHNKITLQQLSDDTNISINTIKKWGQGAEATVGNLLLVAQSLDVSVDYLVGNTDDPQSHKSGSERELSALEKVRKYVDHEISQISLKKDDK